MKRVAFIPVEAEDGRFTTVMAGIKDSAPRVERGRFKSFSRAELEALRRNKAAGIPARIWWAVAERLKNADV
jgi:hypothetical protein